MKTTTLYCPYTPEMTYAEAGFYTNEELVYFYVLQSTHSVPCDNVVSCTICALYIFNIEHKLTS